jgi:DNA (cytosine-5)-methyltransferase 1
VWFAEIEPFPSAVLAHHYPDVPNLGDMTRLAARILAGEVEAPDILVGGTPCQSFSVAGLRKGLDDPRGQLTRSFVEIADAIDTVRAAQGLPPAIILWENVPGVLSDNGNAFGNFLGALAGEDIALDPSGGKWTNAGLVLGPTREVCWRVLDAQYFGVAQRRRRVFVVAGSRTGGVRASQVLLVESGVRRDSPPSREAGQRPAPTLAARTRGGGGLGTDFDLDGGLVADGAGRDGGVDEVYAFQPRIARNGRGDMGGTIGTNADRASGSAPMVAQTIAHVGVPDVAWCLQHRDSKGVDSDTKPGHVLPVAFDARQSNVLLYGDKTGPLDTAGSTIDVCVTGDKPGPLDTDGSSIGVLQPIAFSSKDSGNDATMNVLPTLRSGGHTTSHANAGVMPAVAIGMAVRRLTPTECERLQGFPDDYTRIPWKKKPSSECPDGPRYKALGNSMAVPCMNWIGRKIDKEYRKRRAADIRCA